MPIPDKKEIVTPMSPTTVALANEGLDDKNNTNYSSDAQQLEGEATAADTTCSNSGCSRESQSTTPQQQFNQQQVEHPMPTSEQRKKKATKLFVGGLPKDVTQEEFTSFFARYGNLVECWVATDKRNDRTRGFGFVIFEDPQVAQTLLAIGNENKDARDGFNDAAAPYSSFSSSQPLVSRLDFRGKLIELKEAVPKDSDSQTDYSPPNYDYLTKPNVPYHHSAGLLPPPCPAVVVVAGYPPNPYAQALDQQGMMWDPYFYHHQYVLAMASASAPCYSSSLPPPPPPPPSWFYNLAEAKSTDDYTESSLCSQPF